jgi:choline kinase
MKAIILAAGMGTRLASVTGGMPKCLVEVGGVPLLDRLIERIGEAGIEEVILFTGHRAVELRTHVEGIDHPLAKSAVFVHNDHYSDMGNFYSLLVAEEAVSGSSFIKIDGDVLMDATILPKVLAAPGPAVLAVDRREGLGEEEMKVRLDSEGYIVELNKRMDPSQAAGEYIGVDRVDADITGAVFDMLRLLMEVGETDEYYERGYERLMQSGTRYVVADVTGCKWTEIDDDADLKLAEQMLAAREV